MQTHRRIHHGPAIVTSTQLLFGIAVAQFQRRPWGVAGVARGYSQCIAKRAWRAKNDDSINLNVNFGPFSNALAAADRAFGGLLV